MTKLVGKAWTDRVKYILMRAFNSEARQRKLERQEKLRLFLTALQKRSADMQQRWNDAKAAISTSTDFGVRQMIFIARESFKVLGELLYDKIAEKLVDWVQQGIFSTIANVLAKVVNGVCGLIPEVGAAICAVITGVVVAAYDWLLVKILKVLVSEGLRTAFLAVFNVVVDAVTKLIQKPITGAVDGAIARSPVLGALANVLNPFIYLFFDVLGEWASTAGVRLSVSYSVRGCERGRCSMSGTVRDPKQGGTPENAYSARVVEMGDRLMELVTSAK